MNREQVMLEIEQAVKEETAYLDLRSNRLSVLPPEIGQLTNLTELDLGDNQLSVLPPEIGQLTRLEWLSLDNNQLSELPPEIGQLTNLTELDLRSNQLSVLPPEIEQLTNLTWLCLRYNPLKGVANEGEIDLAWLVEKKACSASVAWAIKNFPLDKGVKSKTVFKKLERDRRTADWEFWLKGKLIREYHFGNED